MGYEIRPVDITKIKCDAIVNSLGVLRTINEYGSICRSIIKASTKPTELKEFIASKEKEANPGKIFLSKSFGLPARNIIHVVTPYFSEDPQMFALEFVYKLILITATKNGWKHIAIPIIGTGANQYPHSYVLKMVRLMVDAFSKFNPNLKVTVCMPVVSEDDYEKKFDEKEIDKSIKEYFKKNTNLNIRDFHYDEYTFEEINYKDVEYLLNYSDEMLGRDEMYFVSRRYSSCYQPEIKGFLDEKEALLNGGKRPTRVDVEKLRLFSITDYINTYIENRYDNESDRKLIRNHVNEYISGDSNSTSLRSKHSDEEKRDNVKVSTLMRYVLALHMTRKEADEFLLFCGKALAPSNVSIRDKTYAYFISHKIYDVDKVNGLCLKEKIDLVFGYDR